MFAQAMLEKVSLDGLSTGLSQVRHLGSQLAQDERTLIVVGLVAIIAFGWRMIR
jgi:hypothetical protein